MAKGDASLVAAGILTAGMGVYHFFLPAQFGWGDALAHDRMLHWALFSINTFFSYLLLAGGALTIAIARRPGPRDRAGGWLLYAMLGFWLLNAAYQLLSPMPLPARLAILRWVLVGFAVLVVVLYATGLTASRRSSSGAIREA
jgi:hypothetical protein